MQQLDDVVRIISMLNRRGIKAIAKNVCEVGHLYYSQRHIHRMIKKLAAEGRLVKASPRVGYIPV